MKNNMEVPNKRKIMTKLDYIIIGIIILIYTILSFINLGSLKNPQTFYNFELDEAITFKFKNKDNVNKLKLYNGNISGKYVIYTSVDDNSYKYIDTITKTSAFSWTEKTFSTTAKYIKILSITENSSLGEISFYNDKNEQIKITSVNSSYEHQITDLTDEQKVIPTEISYLNSSYFDEIYFARTAYEYTKNIEAYEWVHPPLGKLIQAIPIYLSNTMSPFFYRFMGNIAGIIMIFIMYVFSKKLFKKRIYTILSALLMTFDTFHFAHTRMGTIDSFLVLFIMLSLYFMYKYVTEKNSKYSLFLSGLFFGLSVCTKWTGFLAGIALAIIYFIDLFKTRKHLLKSITKGFIYFVIIPLIIYISIYLIFPNNQVTYTDSIKDIIIQTKEIFNYHSKLEATHSFSSEWYTWPISYKPVWYYTKSINETTRQTIVGIGNIAIWWVGIIAILYLLYKVFRKKDKEAIFLLISILSLWLPYIFIGRVMFLYHFFPVLPFVMLAITLMLRDITEKTKKNYIIPIYIIIVIVVFIIYYPAISGIPTNNSYLDKIKLLSSWYF